MESVTLEVGDRLGQWDSGVGLALWFRHIECVEVCSGTVQLILTMKRHSFHSLYAVTSSLLTKCDLVILVTTVRLVM